MFLLPLICELTFESVGSEGAFAAQTSEAAKLVKATESK